MRKLVAHLGDRRIKAFWLSQMGQKADIEQVGIAKCFGLEENPRGGIETQTTHKAPQAAAIIVETDIGSGNKQLHADNANPEVAGKREVCSAAINRSANGGDARDPQVLHTTCKSVKRIVSVRVMVLAEATKVESGTEDVPFGSQDSDADIIVRIDGGKMGKQNVNIADLYAITLARAVQNDFGERAFDDQLGRIVSHRSALVFNFDNLVCHTARTVSTGVVRALPIQLGALMIGEAMGALFVGQTGHSQADTSTDGKAGLRERVQRAIEDDIATGHFAPGSKLDERSLAVRYALSRTPVREALNRLASTGLVEARPRQGTFVRAVPVAELMAMFEMNCELEALAARLAARRMTAAERAGLTEMVETGSNLAQQGGLENYLNHNARIHAAISAGTHNSVLDGQIDQIKRRSFPYRRSTFNLPGRLAASAKEHLDIATAIVAGDEDQAFALMHAHTDINRAEYRDIVYLLLQRTS